MRSGAVFACLAWLLCGTLAAASCSNDTVWIRGDFGAARFSVELADDPEERALGLMHRETMPLSAGMLFIYPAPQRLSFWMRNTLIELDMLFIGPRGVVRRIHHRAQPLDETAIVGGDGLTHVLEINGGLARQLGLSAGDQVRHPSFAQSTAAWPC